jgi:Protein of unknown function (DUF3631)
MAGLDDLPDTIGSRAINIRMRRRAPNERVEPWRHRINAPQAEPIFDQLVRWSEAMADQVEYPDMPDGIEDRHADVWEAPLAVAHLAGGHWPERANVAAVALVADARGNTQTLGVRLLADLRDLFGDQPGMHTDDLLRQLNGLEDAPWADIRNGVRPEDKELDSRGLGMRLRKYGVKPKDVRIGFEVRKGYTAEDLADAWARYLPAEPEADTSIQRIEIITEEKIKGDGGNADAPLAPQGSATSATSATPATNGASGPYRNCTGCGARYFAISTTGVFKRCRVCDPSRQEYSEQEWEEVNT